LGDFTNEIDPKDGNYIAEFTSTGAKSYGYVLDSGKAKVTVKGIVFNYQACEKLNYAALENIVCADQNAQIVVPQYKFLRKKHEWTVRTAEQNKIFKFTFDKRILLDNFESLPYGY
jgi:hypothetical protein